MLWQEQQFVCNFIFRCRRSSCPVEISFYLQLLQLVASLQLPPLVVVVVVVVWMLGQLCLSLAGCLGQLVLA